MSATLIVVVVGARFAKGYEQSYTLATRTSLRKQ